LGNPAKYAGFPLFHRLGYGRLTKPDISLATKTGHFNLLTTETFASTPAPQLAISSSHSLSAEARNRQSLPT
ncbi:MAG: hypothetical protein ABSG40_23295, partial [Terriglobales bacterium]